MADLENLENPTENSGEGSSTPAQQGEGTPGQNEGEKKSSESDGQPSGAPAIDFSHPALKGKTPEEVETLFSAYHDANRAQNEELNRYHEKVQTLEQKSAPAPGPSEAPADDTPEYADDFMKPGLEVLEKRLRRDIRSTLDEVVAPLRKTLTSGEAKSARTTMREKYRYFGVLETTIDNIIRHQGKNPSEASEQDLDLIYHTAAGYAVERGVDLAALAQAEAPAPETPTNGEPPARESGVNIPQRRPSSAPLPPSGEKGKKLRELTEEERIVARAQNLTPEEYLKGQSQHEDEVVKPGFSADNW